MTARTTNKKSPKKPKTSKKFHPPLVAPKNQDKTLEKMLLIYLALFLAVVTIYLLPNALSSDPCFDDWDIPCTTAPGVLRSLEWIGLIAFVIVWTMLPAALVGVVIWSVLLFQKRKKSSGVSKK